MHVSSQLFPRMFLGVDCILKSFHRICRRFHRWGGSVRCRVEALQHDQWVRKCMTIPRWNSGRKQTAHPATTNSNHCALTSPQQQSNGNGYQNTKRYRVLLAALNLCLDPVFLSSTPSFTTRRWSGCRARAGAALGLCDRWQQSFRLARSLMLCLLLQRLVR